MRVAYWGGEVGARVALLYGLVRVVVNFGVGRKGYVGTILLVRGGRAAGSDAGVAGGVVVWWPGGRGGWNKWRRTGRNGRIGVWRFMGVEG